MSLVFYIGSGLILKVYFYGDAKMKKRKSLTLDQNVLYGIKELARQEKRSVSGMINEILKEHLETLEAKEQKQQEEQ